MKFQTTKTESVEATPELVAQAFFEMDNDQQREFFEQVARLFEGLDFDNQMFHVVTSELSADAREIMLTIGRAAL